MCPGPQWKASHSADVFCAGSTFLFARHGIIYKTTRFPILIIAITIFVYTAGFFKL